MSDVKWIKITTDIFDDEKILLIESLPDSNAIIVVWFKLLCLAGKMNNSGVFMMNDKIAYTDKMLSTIFRMKETTVQYALQTFEQFGMIEMINGVITIPNWNKHQTLDSYERKKERDRIYQQSRREMQRQIAEKSSDKSSDVAISDIEEDKEEDNIIISNDIIRQTNDSPTRINPTNSFILEQWNKLSDYGIAPVKTIAYGTKRYKSLQARIREYGEQTVLDAIEIIKKSDFLLGKHSGKPWQITFDWFVLPNNFPKVLEGNYLNAEYKNMKSEQQPQPTVSISEQVEESIDLWDCDDPEEYARRVKILQERK